MKRRRTKWLLTVLMAGILIFTGCTLYQSTLGLTSSSEYDSKGKEAKLNIVATTTILTDLATVICGDVANVQGLMGPGIDPHLYQASAGKRPGKEDVEIAKETIKKVGMEKFMHRQISQLSGGQQQRTFLARALVQEADIYFMDEPFKGVDAQTEKAIVYLLKELKKQGKTVVVVHHDLQTVTEYFDWVAFINLRVIASGPVYEVFNDSNIKAVYKSKSTLLKTKV